MVEIANPQLLDDAVFQRYLHHIANKDFDRVLDSLLESAASVEKSDYEGDPSERSVGTIIHIMVDSVRVLNGEIGDSGRVQLFDIETDRRARMQQVKLWQSFANAFEYFDSYFGLNGGRYAQALRDEMANTVHSDTSTTRRMLRLWEASRPFMNKWHRWCQTHSQSVRQSAFLTEDAGFAAIMEHCFGRPENWSQSTWALHAELAPSMTGD